MEVTILAGAEADLFEAWKGYEELATGLGDRFDQAVRQGFRQLCGNPESAPRFAGEFRRLLLRRFEHGIFYRVHGKRIVITAVMSLRQDPQTILKRLEL